MAEAGGHKAKIIIKKVKKGGHGGAHGGSWKVAYADFVTAMMAFFLLMWLLNSVSKEKKEELSGYFKEFSLFKEAGPSAIPGTPAGDTEVFIVEGPLKRPDGPAAEGGGPGEALRDKLEQVLGSALPELKDQLVVQNEEGGKVRIELVEKVNQPIFLSGKTELTTAAKAALRAVAETLRSQNVTIGVEGHTDASSYSTSRFTNWELSSDRASSARRELERWGVPPEQISSVTGYAATKPFNKVDPLDPRNRRISLLIEPKAQPKPKPKQVAPGPNVPPPSASQTPVPPQPAAPEPPAQPKPGEILEKQIEKMYERGTQGRF